jgi:hypothetical protein
MQITIKQDELEIAVRDFITKMGVSRPIGEITFTVDLHLKLTQDLHLILTHPGRQIMA